MTDHVVTCRQVVEIVSDYLDDELAPDFRAAVEDHLAVCPGCLEYLSQMRTTVGSLRDIDTEDLPSSMVSQLVSAFSEARRHPPSVTGEQDPAET